MSAMEHLEQDPEQDVEQNAHLSENRGEKKLVFRWEIQAVVAFGRLFHEAAPSRRPPEEVAHAFGVRLNHVEQLAARQVVLAVTPCPIECGEHLALFRSETDHVIAGANAIRRRRIGEKFEVGGGHVGRCLCWRGPRHRGCMNWPGAYWHQAPVVIRRISLELLPQVPQPLAQFFDR